MRLTFVVFTYARCFHVLLEGFPDVRLIAHRGASARAPENTLTAFRAALEDGADGVELDARLTADDVVVVLHDDDVSRVSGAAGRVSEMTFEQLRALLVRGSERIPSLTEVLEVVSGRVDVVVEIKGAFGGARAIPGEEVARVVRGRLTNPRWIAGMLGHGHRGVAEIAQGVDALYAFAATTRVVPNHLFDITHDALIADEPILAKMIANNPAAAAAIASRLRDAMARGLWVARRNAVAAELDRAIANSQGNRDRSMETAK